MEAMPTDWARALAVVAHPDDLEYGTAGAIAVWTAAGCEVRYLLVTRGEAGIDGIAPPECGPLREAEQRAAGAAVGVSVIEFLDHNDGVIEYGPPLRRDIAAAIRRHRPELVLTINHHAHWAGGVWNSADHRAVGIAVLDAVVDAGNRWIFPDVGEPWGGVRWVAVAGSPHPTHVVDISATYDAAVASLAAHRCYLEALGTDPRAVLDTITGGRRETAFELFGE